MSMVVRVHLPFEIRDSIMLPRQFLPSSPWLEKTTRSISHLHLHSILCYVASLGNAYNSAYDSVSDCHIGSTDWWRRNFFGSRFLIRLQLWLSASLFLGWLLWQPSFYWILWLQPLRL
jgi:hypothetical protein